MKQTVVEWLEDNLIGNPFSEEDFEHNRNMFKKAKEMGREQIERAYHQGVVNEISIYSTPDAEQYYNQTFNTKEK